MAARNMKMGLKARTTSGSPSSVSPSAASRISTAKPSVGVASRPLRKTYVKTEVPESSRLHLEAIKKTSSIFVNKVALPSPIRVPARVAAKVNKVSASTARASAVKSTASVPRISVSRPSGKTTKPTPLVSFGSTSRNIVITHNPASSRTRISVAGGPASTRVTASNRVIASTTVTFSQREKLATLPNSTAGVRSAHLKVAPRRSLRLQARYSPEYTATLAEPEVDPVPKEQLQSPDVSIRQLSGKIPGETYFYCPICLENTKKVGRRIAATKCGHVFCIPCLEACSKSKGCCPLCQKTLNLEHITEIFL